MAQPDSKGFFVAEAQIVRLWFIDRKP